MNVIANRDINLRADRHVFIKAGRSIRMQAAGTKFTIINGNIQTNATFHGPKVNAFVCGVFPGPGAGCSSPGGAVVERVSRPILPQKREPTDRAKTYNKPFQKAESVDKQDRPPVEAPKPPGAKPPVDPPVEPPPVEPPPEEPPLGPIV